MALKLLVAESPGGVAVSDRSPGCRQNEEATKSRNHIFLHPKTTQKDCFILRKLDFYIAVTIEKISN